MESRTDRLGDLRVRLGIRVRIQRRQHKRLIAFELSNSKARRAHAVAAEKGSAGGRGATERARECLREGWREGETRRGRGPERLGGTEGLTGAE